MRRLVIMSDNGSDWEESDDVKEEKKKGTLKVLMLGNSKVGKVSSEIERL